MKILYVTAMTPFGSAEAFLIPEILESARQGDEILLVPRSPPGELVHRDAEALLDVTIAEPLCSVRILRAAAGFFAARRANPLAALALLRESRSASVLLKNLAVFPKALWLAGVARSRGAEHIHAHWALTTATMAMIAGRVSGIPWSFTAHRGDIVEDNLLKTKVHDASFVRVISESGRRLVESIAGRGAAQKCSVIHMGVPVANDRSAAPLLGPATTVLCPANLLPVKGHEYLLRAIAILEGSGVDCTVDLAGDGPLRLALRELAAAVGVSHRVRFLGQVPHNGLLARYCDPRMGAVVLPSVDLGAGTHEGIPVVLMEAMSHGVPVISTTTGGIPELLGGDAGILVPPADPAALAEAIARVVSNPSLRTRLSQAGRNRVIREFAVHRTVGALRERIMAVSALSPDCQPHQPKSRGHRKAA